MISHPNEFFNKTVDKFSIVRTLEANPCLSGPRKCPLSSNMHTVTGSVRGNKYWENSDWSKSCSKNERENLK